MAPSMAAQPAKEAAPLPRLLEVINSGAFGEVYRGALESGEEVAVKVIPLNENTNYDTLERELYLCKELVHPCIVHTYDIIHTDEAVFVIQEYCARGDLFEVIPPLVGIQDEAKIKKYFGQLVDAVAYLHSRNIVHRDIKPENVVITDKDDIRLIDFGLSGFEGEEVEPMVGTVPYMAPEAYTRRSRRQQYGGMAADMFSLGIVLHVMIRGFYPWDCPSRHEPTFDSFIINGFSFCQNWAPVLDKIFRGCLALDPRHRLTAVQLQALLAEDEDWGLPKELKTGAGEVYSLALAQEQHGDLRRPATPDNQREFEIVFTDDSRSEQESTDVESLRSFNPDSFNPLKQIPPRRQRFMSECDTGFEIQFDPFFDPNMELKLVTASGVPSGVNSQSEEDDNDTPWWGFMDEVVAIEEFTDSESESSGDGTRWGDLKKDMSFSTIPSFGSDSEDDDHDDAQPPQQQQKEVRSSSSSARRRWGNDSDDDHDEESSPSGGSCWGDMTREMSFSSVPRFDSVGLTEPAPTPDTAPVSLQGGRPLFSVGEDVDADDEVASGSEDDEAASSSGATPSVPPLPVVASLSPKSFATEPAVRRHSINTVMRKAASQPRSKHDRQRAETATRQSQTPKARRSFNESFSPCLCGTKDETCLCSVSSNLAKWCASAFNLRKAVSCINLPSC